MKSLKGLYRIGPGLSPSHTLGPQRAASLSKERHPDAHHYEVELFGLLALTGKRHLTNYTIIETIKSKERVVFFKNRRELKHPNAMQLLAYDEADRLLGEWVVYFIGSGTIQIEGKKSKEGVDVYPHHLTKDIEAYCETHPTMPWEYANHFDLLDGYIDAILQQMMAMIDGGLAREGVFLEGSKLKRIAKELKWKADVVRSAAEREKLLLCAYAYSVSKENVSGSMTVTAPTLGSSGILPALVCYHYRTLGVSREQLRNGLKVVGLLGNLIEESATISGARGGCQTEVSAAAAMGTIIVSYLRGQAMCQIEYVAEIGIEHHLGLTCDPIGGYVAIPCIERSTVGVLRAMDAAVSAEDISDLREYKVSFGIVVNTMNHTGRKVPIELRKTSLSGLAGVVPLR